jgi:uncharacterized protein RhaS with RHS repeats
MYPDYQKDFIHSVSDVDLASGQKKVFAVQNDGLGHTLSELKYEVLGAFTEDDINDPNLQIHSENRMTYDSLGRMIALTDPDADFSTYTEITVHDTIVQKYDKTWIITYDDLGRKERVDYPADQASGISKNKLYYYNNYENSTTVINEESQVTKEVHDWNDNLLRLYQFKDSYMNEAKALVFTYNYDELNRKIRFTDPKGIVTEFFL